MKRLLALGAVSAALFMSSCDNTPVDDPSFEQGISAYDAIVVQYEELADKDPLCQSDYLEATTKMLPEISRLSSQKPATGASPAQRQRYLDITMRFQKAMQSLQSKRPTC